MTMYKTIPIANNYLYKFTEALKTKLFSLNIKIIVHEILLYSNRRIEIFYYCLR